MEEKTRDNDEERRENERLTTNHNRSYSRRPLSNQTGQHYPTEKIKRRIPLSIFDDVYHSHATYRRPEVLSSQMKSSSLHHISNPALSEKNHSFHGETILNNEDDDDDNQTKTEIYSFRREFNKLRAAKSHGELYQPQVPLSLPPMSTDVANDNDLKYRTKIASDISNSATLNRSRLQPTAISSGSSITNPVEELAKSSSSQKVPIWKRLKKMITPSKRTKEQSQQQKKQSLPQVSPLQLDGLSSEDLNLTMPDGVTNGHLSSLHNPIKINELTSWLTSKSFPEQRIRDEYDKLPIEPLHPKTVAFKSENRAKNRFNSIEPYDHSRVILQRLPNDSSSDYINASYIDGYRGNRIYIAAQAPTDTTMYDFIRMIWQQGIQSVIMVTRLFEDGKHKCVQYWPDEGEKRVNDIRIRLDGEEKYADYTIRCLTLFNQAEPSAILTVKQYHFLSWPDHGCLSLPTPLLDFRNRFRNEHKSTNPILVHCSAGVGRSGTFIALDALLDVAQYQDTVDVLDFTHRMRQNRVYMIQTADQYVFLYRTFIEGILSNGTAITVQEFLNVRKFPMDIKIQYKLLEQLQSTIEYSYRGALDPNNLNKNRFESILAPDNNRPYLMTQVEKGTDYINAVFVNSYRQNPSYIITQYPLPHTCIDFWRLVYDHNVSIIMLLEVIQKDPKTIPYWSSNIGQIASFGPFEVVLTSQKEDEYLIERIFDLKFTQKAVYNNERGRTVRQFQVKDNNDRLCIVKRFLKEMRTYSGNNVILQCLNGTTFSGYFAALCNSVDKMMTEHIVDPFKTVRLLRSIRPQFIDQNQYESLFSFMFDYLHKYVNTTSLMRMNESSSHANASNGLDQSSIDNRVLQRL